VFYYPQNVFEKPFLQKKKKKKKVIC
jgi:hypothetical protein